MALFIVNTLQMLGISFVTTVSWIVRLTTKQTYSLFSFYFISLFCSSFLLFLSSFSFFFFFFTYFFFFFSFSFVSSHQPCSFFFFFFLFYQRVFINRVRRGHLLSQHYLISFEYGPYSSKSHQIPRLFQYLIDPKYKNKRHTNKI